MLLFELLLCLLYMGVFWSPCALH